MKVSFKMIKKQALVSIIGRMVANMKVIGTKVNNMDQGFLEMLGKEKLNMAYGNMEIVQSGSMKNKLIKLIGVLQTIRLNSKKKIVTH